MNTPVLGKILGIVIRLGLQSGGTIYSVTQMRAIDTAYSVLGDQDFRTVVSATRVNRDVASLQSAILLNILADDEVGNQTATAAQRDFVDRADRYLLEAARLVPPRASDLRRVVDSIRQVVEVACRETLHFANDHADAGNSTKAFALYKRQCQSAIDALTGDNVKLTDENVTGYDKSIDALINVTDRPIIHNYATVFGGGS